ncbi:hypothetical protein C1H46_028286 [Malus baccata]|uniref:Protein kinase domain-containing protein n=1 Tax=Malus baccata TaxID=106549 RepID=A0A540LI19_MALBA|nr:hypothetical protein C1H46_028286 [Malus baccata]
MGSFSSTSSSSLYDFSVPVCSWKGVSCESNNVIGFEASGLELSGPVPDTTIGKLTKLQTLNLSRNKITGLPSDLWSISSLKHLILSNNQISGSLPNNIGNFGLLETLDVSSNNFSGEIPAGISSLASLRVLKLDGNSFEKSIPSGILSCRSLVWIDLSSNRLNGSLPAGFGAALPKLQVLNLAGNGIHGRGSDFSEMNSITTLNISGNVFQGSVMGVFKELLEVADLSRNRFEGHISKSYNWSRLVYLDLSENQLNGEILHHWNQSQNLKHLNLAHNRFTRQEFPRSVETFSGLEYLNLSKSSLTSRIPAEISRLSNLNTLDLSENHLIGKIPLLNLRNLQVFDVSHNNLSGEIPVSLLEKLPWMESFNFSYNNLTICASEISNATLQASFFGSTNSCPIAANPGPFRGPANKAKEHKVLKLALVLTFSMVFLLAGLLFLAVCCRRKTRRWEVKQTSHKEEQSVSGPFSFHTDSTTWVADVKQANSVPVVIFEKPLLNFTFADLLSATSNFDRGTLLAEGKFGPVYRGFLPGGIHVAVKVLVHGSTMTDQEAAREFEYLGRIKHPNLAPLTGYCLAGDQRIAIYDYMENGNIQNLLHDLPLGVLQTTEDWSTDTWEEDNNNGIQNVGSEGLLTSWGGMDEEISRGSPGYMPPEFSQSEYDSPTPKSDVYCFGVVLFELITSKKPFGDDYPEEKDATLVSWVRGLIRKNKGTSAIDPKVRDTGPDDQMEEALKIGYLCTADLPSKRPSMHQIVGLLKDIEQTGNR